MLLKFLSNNYKGKNSINLIPPPIKAELLLNILENKVKLTF